MLPVAHVASSSCFQLDVLPLACVVSIPFAREFFSRSGVFDIPEAIVGLIVNIFCCFFPWILITIPFFWFGVIRNFQQEKNVPLTFRQRFNRIIEDQTFNIDDVLMTLKSVLPLILYSVRDVLEENDMSVKTLDAFVESIQTVNNIQNVYGSYNAVSGASGVATTNVTQTT